MPVSSSSNDLLADRRFAWAKALAAEGDMTAAADLLEQVIARVPAWGPGWAALAETRESCGRTAEAIEAWTQAAALDHSQALEAELHLSRLAGLTPDAMGEDYVKALFDQYAPRFERHLVMDLAYRGPALLIAALDRAAPGRIFSHTLDLGCGTGLMGEALVHRSDRIDGVDLSPAMVEQARRGNRYTDVSVAPLDTALASGSGETYDLVTAADVLVYVGDLSRLFAGAHRRLRPGGLLAFTVQTLAASDETGATRFALGRDLRFSHAPDYVEAVLSRAGFEVALLEHASCRTEKSVAVAGLVVVASKP